MPDLISFVDFVIDVVCMMVPLDEVEALGVTRDESVLILLAAIGLLVLSITICASKEMFPNKPGVAVVVAVCVVVLGYIGLDREMLKDGVFLAGYPPMVITLRFAEGAIVGGRTTQHLRWWHSLLLGGAITAAYFLLRLLPGETMALAKGGWALFGAVVASFAWIRMVADAPIFRSPFSVISVFAVFVSTLAYVSASSFERSLYQWSLPIGFVVGIIGGRMSRQGPDRHDDDGKGTSRA